MDAALSGSVSGSELNDAATLDELIKVENHIKKRFAIGSRLSETRLLSDLSAKVCLHELLLTA